MILYTTGFVGDINIEDVRVFVNEIELVYEFPITVNNANPNILKIQINNETAEEVIDNFPLRREINYNGRIAVIYLNLR